MKRFIRLTLICFVSLTGLSTIVRKFFWRDRVAILIYHNPASEVMSRHLDYLNTFAEFVALSDIDRAGSGRPRVAITFDDGHAGNAALLPLFMKYRVRPTIYLCTGIVAQPRMHWWLHPVAQRIGVKRLIHMPNRKRLDTLAQSGFRQDTLDDEARISGLSRAEIDAMLPYVDFQSHTRSHVTLTQCEDAESGDEISLSKSEVESMVGAPCEHFAYPYGMFGAREVDLLRHAGYRSARTTEFGWNDHRSDCFRLKGFDIDDDASVAWLRTQLTGVPFWRRYLPLGKIRRALSKTPGRPVATHA